MKSVLAYFVIGLAMAFAFPAQARLICNGKEVEGWHFYCDPTPVEEEITEEPPTAAMPTPPVSEPTATEQIEAFRKHADELKHRAILEPTPENLQAYMEVNAQMAKMAGRFRCRMATRVVRDPVS